MFRALWLIWLHIVDALFGVPEVKDAKETRRTPHTYSKSIEASENPKVNSLISLILKHEGGFQNWAEDRGNYHHGKLLGTNYGITPNVLAAARGVKQVTLQDMKNLTRVEASRIYKKNYYEKPKINQLPDAIEPVIFDAGVNSGPSRGIKILQQVLNKAGFPCTVDGVIGHETIDQANAAYEKMQNHLVNAICDERIAWYEQIIRTRPKNAKFRTGWHRRANSFRVKV